MGAFTSGTKPDSAAVKLALEKTYSCLGITCEDVVHGWRQLEDRGAVPHAAGLLDGRECQDVRRNHLQRRIDDCTQMPRLPVQALQAVLRLLRQLRVRRRLGARGARWHDLDVRGTRERD